MGLQLGASGACHSHFYDLNKLGTIVACSGVLFFNDGRVANFDCGCMSAHRSRMKSFAIEATSVSMTLLVDRVTKVTIVPILFLSW